MMTVKWVLLLVTAINRTEFELKPIQNHVRLSRCIDETILGKRANESRTPVHESGWKR